ncbi:hypothetical protein DID88_006437 [Monilinia fructigena]|uniref:Uncharacterized protein n=1 Tax=Monilinia fructigena TaxID=38457 RepID=A0A395ID72_9HELO|nr:hypothetical protein DID88_006437 [Monilinia fructigena]
MPPSYSRRHLKTEQSKYGLQKKEEVQGVLRGHRRGVWSVKFAPKDTPTLVGDSSPASGKGFILTGSGDKTVKIWNLSDY